MSRDWTNWCYHHPRLLLLVVMLAVVAGLSSVAVMPRMEDPPLTPRGGQITTLFPGASPERVESLVTEKIEDRLREIEEIKELRSSSRMGTSVISIELRDDVYEVDGVWSRIRDRLADAQPDLPVGVVSSEFSEMDLKAFALIIAVRWTEPGDVNFALLRRLSEDLEDALLAVRGTEKVQRFGDVQEEVLVELQPSQLAARGLTPQAVSAQLAASDAKTAAGQVRGQNGDLLVDVDGELDTMSRIGRTPIRVAANGQAIRLRDIATISKTIADPPQSSAVVGGQRAIALGAFVREDTRIDLWRERTAEAIDEFHASTPSVVDAQVLLDQSRYVDIRLASLTQSLLLGGAAVLLVIFLVMGASSAIIVGSSLPLAAFIVLFGLRLLNIPIHQMSITGLIIALGLLIDNAIVMVDEVGEGLRSGLTGGAAVSRSVRRLATPLLGSTVTTALAFGPIALMPGPAGEFVGSIGVSVILAIGASFALAMTVVPAFAARGIRPQGQSIWSRGFQHATLAKYYRRSLEFVFRRPALGLALGAALPLLGFYQASSLPEQFFPPADRDQFQIEMELPANTSQQETLDLAAAVRERVATNAEVMDVHWFVGESAPAFYYNLIPRRKGANQYAQALVQLHTADRVLPLIQRLQRDLDDAFPQARILVRQLEQGPPFDAPIELRLFGDDMYQLRIAGDRIRAIMAATPGVIHTKSELSDVLPRVALQPDEEQARLAGLDLTSMSLQLQAALDGSVGGSVLEGTEELPVRVRLPRDARDSMQQLRQLDLVGGANRDADRYQGVPLSAIATTQLAPDLAGIPHFNSRRVNEVQAYIRAGMLPSEALAAFQQRWRESGYELPTDINFKWGGEAAKRDDAVGNLMANVGVLAVLMLATLVLSFGSFRLAGLIAVVGGLAIGLGLAALWLYGFPFGFMAIVGSMGLVGVAINDAIVVLSSIQRQSEARCGSPEKLTDVVTGATRHIVATSLTTMAGFAPLVLSGGGFWPPLAVAISGGVGGATILALYFVPSAYIWLQCRTTTRASTKQPALPAAHAAHKQDTVAGSLSG